MNVRRVLSLAALAALAVAVPAAAHFTVLIAEPPAVARGERTVLRTFFGHPFEHELADAAPPARVTVVTPDGARVDATKQVRTEERSNADGRVRTYTLDHTPDVRGDTLVLVECAEVTHGNEIVTDYAKLVLHVQAQVGWEKPAGAPVEILPLTRPYGLFPGVTFRARAVADGKPVTGAKVYIERYNAAPPDPASMPADELITRVELTDERGQLAVTLPEAGWWVLAVEVPAGRIEKEGFELHIVRRALLWVFVDPS